MAERLRLGRSHADTVYLQTGDQPSDADERVAVFMGPDAVRYAAGFVAQVDLVDEDVNVVLTFRDPDGREMTLTDLLDTALALAGFTVVRRG